MVQCYLLPTRHYNGITVVPNSPKSPLAVEFYKKTNYPISILHSISHLICVLRDRFSKFLILLTKFRIIVIFREYSFGI